MIRSISIYLFTLFSFASWQALAQELYPCAQGRVEKVPAADVLELADGATVRLMMVLPPRMPQGSETGRPWPMAERVLAEIKAVTLGENMTFHCLEEARNRRGELVAIANFEDGSSLQNKMIARGWARVFSNSDFSYHAEQFYAQEKEARKGGQGMWSYDAYDVRTVSELNDRTGRFEIVEGKVVGVATVKNITYLNFGDDWRTDFTLRADWRARRLFEKADIELDSLQGKSIEVRGWVSWYGGPMIELTHPGQMQVLDQNP